MAATKKIAFICSADTEVLSQLDKIRDYDQRPDCQAVVIATEYSAQRACQQQGIPFKTTIDYLTRERHYRAYTESTRLAKEWYRQPVLEKALNHEGVSLCETMEYYLRLAFAGFFLDVELYKGIFETERPDKVVITKRPASEAETISITCMGRQDSFIVSSLSREKGVSLEWTHPIHLSRKYLTGKVALSAPLRRRVLNFATKTLANYKGTFFSGNLPREIRRDLQRLRNFCFCSWTAHRPARRFSRKKRKIAFTELRCAVNIADYLKKDADNGLVCLAGPGEKRRMMSFLPQLYLESFSTTEINRLIEAKRAVFRDIINQAKVVSYLENTFCYNGFNFWAVARKELEYILDIYLPLVVRGMELIKEMITRTGLDVLVSPSDADPVVRTMMRTLQNRGKKTLVLHHGVDYFTPEASEAFGKVLVPPVADKIEAWGDASKDWFTIWGTPLDRVEVASCSDFDDYRSVADHSNGSIRRHLGIPPDKKVILYALDHSNRETRHPYIVQTRDEIIQHLKDVIEGVAALPQLYLIVRPHPGDRHPEDIRQVVRDARQGNILYSDIPLIHQLPAADILLTHSSSSALEAMIFNKDVVIYNPTGRPEVVPYAQEGAAFKVERKEELVPVILEVLANDSQRTKLTESRREFVSRCAGPIDGRATQNIADIILKMINDKR
ncbi:MAG TPA: hypothetical protein G4O18_04595 [Dehalococcoidia bacterium]|nr:hypothetical protein [Dehalococcoidia bacterium]